MVKVKNVAVTEIPFETKDANFQKCLEYIKLVSTDYKKYLPKKPKHQLMFELTESSAELANCIRRFLMDEIIVLSMHVEEDDIKTDDAFILPDFLKKNIELIPFDQDLSETDIENLTLSIDVENKTDDTITIYSGDLIVNTGTKTLSKDDSAKYFSTTIPIIKLRSAMSLKINNVIITRGLGKHDAGKFILLSNISYKIMDVKPVEETKYNKTGESSLNSAPKHFKLGFRTHRNASPKKIMYDCCNQITARLTTLQNELSEIKQDTKVHFSDLIDMETKGDIKIFHFKGEYWTLSNLMAKYCYLLDTDIQFVTSGIIHPSTEESLLKIQHASPINLIIAAIKTIVSDITIVRKAFDKL